MCMNSRYLCPVCAAPLTDEGRTYRCENRHSFDVSAEGYVNLAPTGAASGDNAGDAADSCRARRCFLESGSYRPLAEGICALLEEAGVCVPDSFVIDAGCGEGYYARYVKQYYPSLDIYGVDLAKQAVRMAAKAQKALPLKNHYAVAGIFDLPFADGSAAAMISVFAPVPDAEALRVLKPGGVLIAAGPGKRHLFGLKQALYDTPNENQEKVPEYAGFAPAQTRRIAYEMHLSGQTAACLFAMTPYFWRSAASVREKAAALTELTTEADFLVKLYRRI